MAQSQPANEQATANTTMLVVRSPAFDDGMAIPPRYTGIGDDALPPISWSKPPDGTKSLALVCDDIDAAGGMLLVHWIVWNIDPLERALPDAFHERRLTGARQGKNGLGTIGWAGPKPPRGERHRYVFRLFALATRLDLPVGASRSDLLREIHGSIVAEGTLTGTFLR